MRKMAALYGGNSHQHRTFNEPKYRRFFHEIIYLPDFAEASLDDIDILLVPSQLHLGMLIGAKDKIKQFADNGGTVIALGGQPQDWIPGQNWEFRPTNFWWWLEKDAKSGLMLSRPEHDLFRYMTLEDATWHYHGVFWPPEGSDVLISTEDHGAILYVDKVSSAGTWIVTTLDPEYHYGSYFMPATEKFLDGFLPWVTEGAV